MSFGEKIASIMQKPGQDPVAKDDVPWWMKYAGRGLGTVGSIIAIFLGAWNCAFIIFGHIDCLISGMWQMIAGFLVVMIEAPCCCLFIDFVQNLSDWVEKKPYWNRAAAYCLIALPAVFLCPGISSIFGNGLIFTTGIIYGLMSLGKKAPFGEMRTTALDTQAPSSSMRSTLVENTQPIDLSSTPVKEEKIRNVSYENYSYERSKSPIGRRLHYSKVGRKKHPSKPEQYLCISNVT